MLTARRFLLHGAGGMRSRLLSATASASHSAATPEMALSGLEHASSAPPPREDIDWSSLTFSDTHLGSAMYRSTFAVGKSVSWKGSIEAFAPLQLSPAAQVLNYGQSIFEGLKAYRTEDGGIVVFRPEANAARMAAGAGRMMMPPVSKDMFIQAVTDTVKANADLVPPVGTGSLYLRPVLMGTGSTLGVKPAPEYTFMVYCAAVGPYFKGGKMAPIHLLVAENAHRAVRGGTGSTKAAGNYAPCMANTEKAKQAGYTDVVYMDAETGKCLEEVSACNIFAVKGNRIRTPPLSGTILHGVTRDSVIQLARMRGYEVEEAPLPVTEALESEEMFTSGTAVVVAPVGSLTYQEKTATFSGGKPGPVAQELYQALVDLQQGRAEDPLGWMHRIC